MSLRTPKYRLHRGGGQALVQINGERVYLGKHGTEASREKYHRLIAAFLASGRQRKSVPPTAPASAAPIPVTASAV
jgi:hypothetical protein